MTRSRTISITVNKRTGETFDAILHLPSKMMPGAKKGNDGWWSFTGPYGKSRLRFSEDRPLGVLDHQYVDEKSSWNIPMRVVASGDSSEVVITLNKPAELTDEQFDQRVAKLGEMTLTMKDIIESGT